MDGSAVADRLERPDIRVFTAGAAGSPMGVIVAVSSAACHRGLIVVSYPLSSATCFGGSKMPQENSTA